MIRPLLLAAALFPCLALADFSQDFQKLREADKPTEMVKFLDQAATAEADNPDYYALASNYWWTLASAINISTKPADPGEPSIRDQKTGAEVGSIGTNGDLDPSLRKKAIALTTEGFRRFPQRLDIRFGLARVLYDTGDQKTAVATLLKILEISKVSDADLKWTGNAKLPEPAATFVPDSIQGYTAPLFQAGTPETDALCKKLLDATTAAYPDHPFAYNLLAALADAQGDKKEALRQLETAHQKAPADTLILMNLADAHRAAGDTPAALKAYRKVLELKPDEEMEKEVKEGIKALEGKEGK